MIALQCEICGGKLMAKSGGIFECEFCGLQYDKSRVQEMVQEIKGTVKVEGMVQVQGTVSVDNKENKTNLLKRIAICAEDRNFGKVCELTEELLKLDPECGEAYLWQAAAGLKSVTIDGMFKLYPEQLKKARESAAWKNALRYLDKDRAASMEQRLKEAIDYWNRSDPALKKRFAQIQPARELLFSLQNVLLGLQADGTVRVTYTPEEAWVAPVAKWTCVKKLFVAPFCRYVLGLRWDGKVLGVSGEEIYDDLVKDVTSWPNNESHIVDMAVDGSFVTALFEDGELCSTEDQYDEDGTFYFGYASDWEDVGSLCILRKTVSEVNGDFFGKYVGHVLKTVMVMGVTRDGHVRCSASGYDLEDLPRLDVKLGVPWWEARENVARISPRNENILFRDGTISDRDEKQKFLDFGLSDKGRVMEVGCENEFRERNLVSVAKDFALRADGTVLRAIQRDPKHRSSYEDAKTEDWTHMVALYSDYLGGAHFVLGIQEDGCVRIAWSGTPAPGISVEGWKLFNSVDTILKERKTAQTAIKKKAKEKLQAVWDEKGMLARERAAALRERVVCSSLPTLPIYMCAAVNGSVSVSCRDKYGREAASQWSGILALSVAECHALGLREDGTVLACGDNSYGQCDVAGWKYIRKVVAMGWHSVGLRDDGTAIACGASSFGQTYVQDWKDLVDIAAGRQHTVGLKRDGTVVACGLRDGDRCKVYDWKNVVKIFATNNYTVGICRDGSVLCTRKDFAVSGWKNIVDVATGVSHLLGLTADGSVVATGDGSDGSTKVKTWKNIVAISALACHSVGLRADGTVVAAGDDGSGQCDVSQWADVVAICAGPRSTLGICADGSVLFIGDKEGNVGLCRISKAQRLFDNAAQLSLCKDKQDRLLDSIRRMRAYDAEAAKRRNGGLCQHCGGELKGLFSKKCVLCGMPKDY